MSLYSYKDAFPQIKENVYIADNSSVIGSVVIGAKSSVWFGTVIRGDLSSVDIGTQSNIQDRAVIHVSSANGCSIGNNVSIGHGAIIHACTIEDCCLIGMGAIILDGAVIGKGSIIGAGSLVTKNTIIPSGVLAFGSPSTVIRNLTKEEIEGVLSVSAEYVRLSSEYSSTK